MHIYCFSWSHLRCSCCEHLRISVSYIDKIKIRLHAFFSEIMISIIKWFWSRRTHKNTRDSKKHILNSLIRYQIFPELFFAIDSGIRDTKFSTNILIWRCMIWSVSIKIFQLTRKWLINSIILKPWGETFKAFCKGSEALNNMNLTKFEIDTDSDCMIMRCQIWNIDCTESWRQILTPAGVCHILTYKKLYEKLRLVFKLMRANSANWIAPSIGHKLENQRKEKYISTE